jgi:hypothetical protein
MKRPLATFHDALTNITEVREMTEEEYVALVESGWTETPPEEATEE